MLIFLLLLFLLLWLLELSYELPPALWIKLLRLIWTLNLVYNNNARLIHQKHIHIDNPIIEYSHLLRE